MEECIRLDASERRVLGVLMEKGLTTPQNYPLSLNAIVAGCNQKSNRDPVVEMVDDEVEEVLQRLRTQSLTTVTFPASSRVEKWRQELSTVLDLNGQEMAVVAELLLRGPQTVGELRGRASRMKPIAGLPELEDVLQALERREPPLVVRLTPPEVKRGARVTHGLYAPEELERIRSAEAVLPSPTEAARSPRAAGSPALVEELADLRRRVEAIETRLGLGGSDGSAAETSG